MKPLITIGIAGGTGSGKTTVAALLAEDLGEDRVTMVVQDRYYKDLGHLPLEQRARANFDHPDAVDVGLMAHQVRELKAGRAVEAPRYDFRTHSRLPECTRLEPREILLVEGILVLELEEIRRQLDLKVYVETDDDLRFIRRLRRDIHERGRTVDSVVEQYLSTVRPMHHEFVEKSRRHADLILPWRDFNNTAIEMLLRILRYGMPLGGGPGRESGGMVSGNAGGKAEGH
ncbi:MAG TPA: uridine kinase [Myxococcota bacterium]|nr:uridine kinase [Myxococcota bacterium]HQK52028.1 uridine kinase [Myxococcota bacterium]